MSAENTTREIRWYHVAAMALLPIAAICMVFAAWLWVGGMLHG